MSIEVSIKKKLKGFTLDISFRNHGGCMGILGASGCGKSMTLKCIAGIEKPTEGRIILNERKLYDSKLKINISPQARKTGYLFQNYALFPNMTVGENIGVGLSSKKANKKATIQDYLERFRLGDLKDRYPSQLSGGQQQRVALARIMAYQPDLILLDEPFSALDSFLKDVLQQELLSLLKDYHGDVIIVSHSRDEIYKFCDHMVIMDSGKPLLAGNTKDLFANPGVMEAARLTGCKNISQFLKLSDYELLALDWNIRLKTSIPIEPQFRYVGIRARCILPSLTPNEENTIPVLCVRQSETPFEHEYILKNKDYPVGKEIWWKENKNSLASKSGSKSVPEYITLPKEDIMLLI